MMGLGLCPNTGNPHTMATNTVDMSKLNGTNEEQRMYICNIAGCMKQYRNTNTLSHHRRTVHKINANGIGVARNSMIKNTAHVTAMNNSNSITAKMIIDPRLDQICVIFFIHSIHFCISEPMKTLKNISVFVVKVIKLVMV